MAYKIYLPISTERAEGSEKETYVLGAYSTLEGAQHKLQSAIIEDLECNKDRGPFIRQEDAEDICFLDAYQTEYHYTILERTLDE